MMKGRARQLSGMLGIIIFVVMMASVLGCGEETTTTEVQVEEEEAEPPAGAVSADIPDPCVLLTKAEIESINGVSLGEPTRTDQPGLRSCDYQTADLESFGLAVFKPCDKEDFEFMITGVPVEGLGEQADWDELTSTITVRTRNNECLVTGASVGDEPAVALEKAKTAMRTALQRIE